MKSRLRTLAILLPLVLLAGQAVAADEVFKWKDEKGRWQYGNQPPAGVKAEKLNATISTVPAYKPKPVAAPQAPAEEAPAARAGMPTEVTAATRKQMLEACEKAGGNDCPAVVNAALNAVVNQAKANQSSTGSSSSSGGGSGGGTGNDSTSSQTSPSSRSNAY